jgi:hypothetical protein
MSTAAAPAGATVSPYSPTAPLLLFTDFSPDFGGGGAIILRSLLAPLDLERLLWVTATPASTRVPTRVVQLSTGSFGNAQRRSSFLDSTLFSRTLAREVLAIARAHSARGIWIVLHGLAVPLAAELVRQRVLPVHVTVHDDPPFAVALRSRRYLALVPWLEHCLRGALAGATSVDVISEGMRRRYAKRYGARSIVVHRALPGPVSPSPATNVASGLSIGVLGNTYTYEQLPILATAVARASRELGVPGTITFVGFGHAQRLKRDLGRMTKVKILEVGHLDEDQAVQLLQNQFLLYLNYPFGWRNAALRQSSFPTKLSTYVLAARPLLVHAPRDSTLSDIASFDGYVLPWTSVDPSEGARLLVDAWKAPLLHRSVHVEAESVRGRYFDLEENRTRLWTALNELVLPAGARSKSDRSTGAS